VLGMGSAVAGMNRLVRVEGVIGNGPEPGRMRVGSDHDVVRDHDRHQGERQPGQSDWQVVVGHVTLPACVVVQITQVYPLGYGSPAS
jgi:hypothetical protein